jgi:hypothetical protein
MNRNLWMGGPLLRMAAINGNSSRADKVHADAGPAVFSFALLMGD